MTIHRPHDQAEPEKKRAHAEISIDAAPGGSLLQGALLQQLLDEAVAVAEETRMMIQTGVGGLDPSQPLDRLIASGELSRITARVGHCVAWLLVRRAVAVGELSADEAAQDGHRLDGRDTCLAESPHPDRLTRGLRKLLTRSAALYGRIERLDRQLDAVAPPPPRVHGDGPRLRPV